MPLLPQPIRVEIDGLSIYRQPRDTSRLDLAFADRAEMPCAASGSTDIWQEQRRGTPIDIEGS
jgi:hypothetical protein